jgi:hypothetical protein
MTWAPQATRGMPSRTCHRSVVLRHSAAPRHQRLPILLSRISPPCTPSRPPQRMASSTPSFGGDDDEDDECDAGVPGDADGLTDEEYYADALETS